MILLANIQLERSEAQMSMSPNSLPREETKITAKELSSEYFLSGMGDTFDMSVKVTLSRDTMLMKTIAKLTMYWTAPRNPS